MALRNKKRRQWQRFALLLPILIAASALTVPASAQWFGSGFPFGYGQRPPPPRNSFSFPFFEHPGTGPFMRPPQPVESTKAPPPRKPETAPTITIDVIGDSMADWLAYGLEERFADSPEIGVVRKIRPTSGLVRYDPHNDTLEWSQAIKDILADDKPSAIVVMLGLNDRLPLRGERTPRAAAQHNGEALPQAADQGSQSPRQASDSEPAPGGGEQPSIAGSEAQHEPQGGVVYEFRTDQWADLYVKRIDDMIAALKSKGVPVLWVGLPAVRGSKSTSDMSYLDELYRERAERAGIVYVDIWDGFVDENGRYANDGPDYEGQIRRLRTYDGVHFTKAGAVKLASYVEQQLRRVMSNHLAPVTLPAPEATSPTKPGGQRPVVGPVLPLTASDSNDGNDLLGAGPVPSPAQSDPLATEVLSRGDALTAPVGRADNFSWPRSGAGANGMPNVAPRPVALTPPAGRSDLKKPDDAKNKGKAAAGAATAHPRRSPHAALDGAPRPPMPIGPAAADTR